MEDAKPLASIGADSVLAPPWRAQPLWHVHRASRGWGSAPVEAAVIISAIFSAVGHAVAASCGGGAEAAVREDDGVGVRPARESDRREAGSLSLPRAVWSS